MPWCPGAPLSRKRPKTRAPATRQSSSPRRPDAHRPRHRINAHLALQPLRPVRADLQSLAVHPGDVPRRLHLDVAQRSDHGQRRRKTTSTCIRRRCSPARPASTAPACVRRASIFRPRWAASTPNADAATRRSAPRAVGRAGDADHRRPHRVVVHTRDVPSHLVSRETGVARFLVQNLGPDRWMASQHTSDRALQVGIGVLFDDRLAAVVPLRNTVCPTTSRRWRSSSVRRPGPAGSRVEFCLMPLRSNQAKDGTVFHSSVITVTPDPSPRPTGHRLRRKSNRRFDAVSAGHGDGSTLHPPERKAGPAYDAGTSITPFRITFGPVSPMASG